MKPHTPGPLPRHRLYAFGRSVEWLGDPGVQQVLADSFARFIGRIRRPLARRPAESLLACCTPAAILPKDAVPAGARTSCAQTCCA